MALVRWQPRAVADLRSEIDSLFDRFWGDRSEDDAFSLAAWHPSADLEEADGAYVITADLPGLKREDIKVNLANHVLTISGERKSEHKDEDNRRTERQYGSFRRSFTLPSAVDGDNISASYKDGVLTVRLPKSEDAKAKEITVN